jgi:hypothetical protein
MDLASQVCWAFSNTATVGGTIAPAIFLKRTRNPLIILNSPTGGTQGIFISDPMNDRFLK